MINACRPFSGACALLTVLLVVSGCNLRQDMANQARQNPLSPSDFFSDGRSERTLVENTVIRGSIDDDQYVIPKDSNAFPILVTQELLERGRERYGIFCTPCHGIQGDGNGMVAMRGMKHPPSYHSDRLRQAPNGYVFEVITNGFGAMYGYSAQIPPRDRWAIIAYLRALQLSRNAPAGQLPAEQRDRLNAPQATGGTGGPEK
jgi:mono/diheme cytochrome c family protein